MCLDFWRTGVSVAVGRRRAAWGMIWGGWVGGSIVVRGGGGVEVFEGGAFLVREVRLRFEGRV